MIAPEESGKYVTCSLISGRGFGHPLSTANQAVGGLDLTADDHC